MAEDSKAISVETLAKIYNEASRLAFSVDPLTEEWFCWCPLCMYIRKAVNEASR